MKETLLEYLVCPSCRGPLSSGLPRVFGVGGEIRSGVLDCPSCRLEYPVRNYIPRFVPTKNDADSFGVEWKRHPLTQVDRANGTGITRERFYHTTGWPDRLDGQRVLEAGCGSGRFTEIALATGCELVSFDLSEAIDVCLENHGLAPSLHLFQADICRIPLRSGIFDRVFCLGVLQHCPNVSVAFQALLPPLRAGGSLAIDVYEKTFKVFVTPRFWLRLVTSRMRPESLYSLVTGWVPRLLPVKTWLKERVPGIGKYLHIMIPVAYHKGLHPLPESQLLEWSILDTFDMFSPRYENRVANAEVREWFGRAGLVRYTVGRTPHGIIAVAMKPERPRG